MLRKIFSTTETRLFLGRVAVMPRRDLARFLEGFGASRAASISSVIQEQVEEVFALPCAADERSPRDCDIGVDIVVQGYQCGGAADLHLGVGGVPFFWRPKVRVAARLFYLQSNKTKRVIRVARGMTWRAYLSRLFSWKVMLGMQVPAGTTDMRLLLKAACEDLNAKVRKCS